MSYFLALFLVGAVILIHEAGHFIAARCVSLPIRTFSIGFGPALFRFRSGITEYRVSLIPLGGYVLPDIDDEADFFRFPVYKRILLSLGGPLANVAAALVCYGILNSLSPAPTLIGIVCTPWLQVAATAAAMLQSLGQIFQHADQVSGIVGIVTQGGAFIGAGVANVIKFTAFMSLNLAIVNMLPIPALDGGKVILYLLEKIHPRMKGLHLPLSVAGWILILGILVYTTIGDIVRIA